MKKENLSLLKICQIGFFTALIAVLTQLSIPLPLGVPLTLQTLIIPIAGIILGPKYGFISVFIYLLIGALGMPVFSNFGAGFGHIIGPTGGFLVSFPFMAFMAGWGESKQNNGFLFFSLSLGSAVNFLVGMSWFMVVTGANLPTAFTATVLPFIPTGILSIILASILGRTIKTALLRANVSLT